MWGTPTKGGRVNGRPSGPPLTVRTAPGSDVIKIDVLRADPRGRDLRPTRLRDRTVTVTKRNVTINGGGMTGGMITSPQTLNVV